KLPQRSKTLSRLSLLLLLLISFMCVRSDFRGDYFSRSRHGMFLAVGSVIGFICIDYGGGDPRWLPDETRFGSGKAVSPKFFPPRSWVERMGFIFHEIQTREDLSYRLLLPYWVFMLPFAILPGIEAGRLFWRRRDRYRLAHHLCVKCGYDLRESKERCPE